MYHHSRHPFATGFTAAPNDTLEMMVDTIIVRVASHRSIAPHALEEAGFLPDDVHEFYADALANAQTSFWWPQDQFVAIEGI